MRSERCVIQTVPCWEAGPTLPIPLTTLETVQLRRSPALLQTVYAT